MLSRFDRYVIPVHLGLAIALVLLSVETTGGLLMAGLDGTYIRDLVAERMRHEQPTVSIEMDMVRGLGAIGFPLNVWLSPAFALQSLFFDGMSVRAVFGLVTAEIFLSTALLAYALGLSRSVAIAAGWVLVCLTMPIAYPDVWYPFYSLLPHVGENMAICTTIVALLCLSRFASIFKMLIRISAIFTMMLLLTNMNPLLTAIYLPIIFLAGLFCLAIRWRDRREAAVLLASAALCVVVPVALGISDMLMGLASASAPHVFEDEMRMHQRSMHFAGIAHHTYLGVRVGAIVIVMAACGAIIHLLRRGPGWQLAGFFLALAALVQILGPILVGMERYQGPSMLYFETTLWPFYAVYAVCAVAGIGAAMARFVGGAPIPTVWSHGTILLAVAAFALLTVPREPQRFAWPYPPRSNPIIEQLRQETALRPDGRFRGRVATFTGYSSKPEGASWFDQHSFDGGLVLSMGNEMRASGLWHFGIPTLLEYSQTMSAASYLHLTRTLARPIDRQVRNVIMFSHPDPAILASLGVRFLIADHPIAGTSEVMALATGPAGPVLRLLEIAGANLGDWSPTRVHVARDASEVVARFKDGIDPRREVVLFVPIEVPLSAAREAALTFRGGGAFSLRAKSDGWSLLLLPVEHSACLRQSVSRAGELMVLRANLMQAAVLFQGELDAEFRTSLTPGAGAGCRLDDARAFSALSLNAAAMAHPIGR